MKLMPTRKRSLGGRLDEIVGVDGRPREPARKTTQPWEHRYQLIAKPAVGFILVWNAKRRQFR